MLQLPLLVVCHTRRPMCLQDGGNNGPNLLKPAVGLLPSGITRLELGSYCTADAPYALARLTRLRQLDILGNGQEIDWSTPAAAALIPLLRSLRLSFREDTPPAFTGGIVAFQYSLPSSDAAALAAASRLERLALQCQRWSDETGQLLQALPALVDLRWARALRRGGQGRRCPAPEPAAAAGATWCLVMVHSF